MSVSASAQVFRPHVAGGHDRADFRRGPAGHGGQGYSRGHSHGPRFGAVFHPGAYGYRHSYSAPVFGYYEGYSRPDYPCYSVGAGYGGYGSGRGASNGLVLGALAGGIIGHNSGDFRHNGWRGAAWGAGLGLLLGSVVDANRRTVAAPAYSYPPPAPPVVLPAAAPAQPVTIINHYYGHAAPMSGANALFGR
jgi:MFS family permease